MVYTQGPAPIHGYAAVPWPEENWWEIAEFKETPFDLVVPLAAFLGFLVFRAL